MILIKNNLVIFCFFFMGATFSQTTASLNDSLVEYVIYEYDTVYLKPDTTRITVIIEQNELPATKTKKSTAISRFFKQNFRGSILDNNQLLGSQSFLSHLTPHYLSFGVAPFINPHREALLLPDAYTSVSVKNLSYFLLWNYTYGHFVVTVGPGFTRYHDKAQLNTSHYTSNYQSIDSYSYDSLLINSLATSNMYYNYLNIYTSIGYKLVFSKKVSLSLIGGGVTDILIGYRQGDFNTPGVSKTRKFAVNASLYAVMAYKPARNVEFFIAPFYQRLLAINNKYPFTNVQKIGTGIGVNFFLK